MTTPTQAAQTAAPTPLAGFVPGMDEAAYHAHPAISNGFVRSLLRRSPAHARANADEPTAETPALLFGHAVHTRALEPESFGERYAIAPKVDRPTKEGKATWAALCESHPDAVHLSEPDEELIKGIADDLEAHPHAPVLLTNGAPELSGFWTDPDTGIVCRCRVDWLRGDRIGTDLKATADASPDAFQRSIAKYGYYVQAAWYAMGYQAISGEALSDFVFLYVEKAAPFAVGLYRVDSTALALGEGQARRALRTIADCQARDHWPAYPAQVEPIGVPDWLWRAADVEEAAKGIAATSDALTGTPPPDKPPPSWMTTPISEPDEPRTQGAKSA